MLPVRIGSEFHGQFYSGDSYIILNTYEKKGSKARMWDVHFWIGSTSTQDEYGTAAYKTVELDDFLGDAPTQYRCASGRASPAASFLLAVPVAHQFYSAHTTGPPVFA